MRLLLVEDDVNLSGAIERLLKDNDYVVDLAETLELAKASVLDFSYDIILLDRMLPDGEGLELISFCDRKNKINRFIVLTALDRLDQLVEGLDLGADDYIIKPFEPEELLARIRASLRRPLERGSGYIRVGNMTYNKDRREILINEKPLVIPRREMVMLEALIKRFRRIVTRETLEESMYGYGEEILSNSIESHISRLRKNLIKFEASASIHTVRGVGYMLTNKETEV